MVSKNLLLGFPPEIRYSIYKFAVVTERETIDLRWDQPYRTGLAPPRLAQVNKQFRNEIYSLNRLSYDDDSEKLSGIWRLNPWFTGGSTAFHATCECLSQHLQYVAAVNTCAWENDSEQRASFCSINDYDNDEADWADKASVDTLLCKALNTIMAGDLDLWEHIDTYMVADAMPQLMESCTLTTKWMSLYVKIAPSTLWLSR
ncbi:hypothetical protein F5Y19DRAFT_479866 [Xylariaceae sp. FL1651]|nr:hypothetical protein F5Y19DRAFT_479866 [Xylariaceae sp. FL1651]